MPWKECTKVNERLKFVGRIANGEKMTDLCLEFGISRKTGYKILDRYNLEGPVGLMDKSRKPRINGRATNPYIERLVLKMKKERPTWGAPKIREMLLRKHPDVQVPVKSTVHAILDRNGLVKKRGNRTRFRAQGTNLRTTNEPNDLWCTDFKGQFRMLNNQYCYPLTITDHFSRYLLCCEGLSGTKNEESFPVFERVFKEFGLPEAMRSDNGCPFASQALFGLSRLSIWWLRLGIKLERIEPGCPEQNGRHERMHRTLKQEVAGNPGKNLLHQQEQLDYFHDDFNNERPHEALEMKLPKEVYKKSSREYPKFLSNIGYAVHDRVRTVSNCGSINLGKGKRVFISEAMGGQALGLSEEDYGIWQVSFMEYELGFFDEESMKFTPGPNPFIIDPKLPLLVTESSEVVP
jgi:transposase InsO family protein